MRYLGGASALLLLAACSGGNSASSDAPTNIQIPKDTSPPHNYSLEDAGEYGYEAGISEEDARQGKAAADVLMVRYLGEKNGKRAIEFISSDGSVSSTISCADPCRFMKFSDGERVEYNTDSVGGAAMEDAINGQLKV